MSDKQLITKTIHAHASHNNYYSASVVQPCTWYNISLLLTEAVVTPLFIKIEESLARTLKELFAGKEKTAAPLFKPRGGKPAAHFLILISRLYNQSAGKNYKKCNTNVCVNVRIIDLAGYNHRIMIYVHTRMESNHTMHALLVTSIIRLIEASCGIKDPVPSPMQPDHKNCV